jgi:hypothetical protein
MYTYNGGYPLVGYYMPDETEQTKIAFKCKYVQEEGVIFFNRSGMIDTGTSMMLITPKRLEYVKGARCAVDGIRYSVASIQPFIPDKAAGGKVKRKINAEYLISLV